MLPGTLETKILSIFFNMTPTPDEMLGKLISLSPESPSFKKQWEDEDNISKDDDGTFSLHGLFTEFSWFVRDNFHHFSEQQRRELFYFIESWVCPIGQDYDALDNAICACFLENLSCEPPLSGQLRGYMGPNSLEFFDLWDRPRV
jgi:hypothetical protein